MGPPAPVSTTSGSTTNHEDRPPGSHAGLSPQFLTLLSTADDDPLPCIMSRVRSTTTESGICCIRASDHHVPWRNTPGLEGRARARKRIGRSKCRSNGSLADPEYSRRWTRRAGSWYRSWTGCRGCPAVAQRPLPEATSPCYRALTKSIPRARCATLSPDALGKEKRTPPDPVPGRGGRAWARSQANLDRMKMAFASSYF